MVGCRRAEPMVKQQDVWAFRTARDVEIVVRSARVWSDRYTLDKAAVADAEQIIKVRCHQGSHAISTIVQALTPKVM